MDTIEERAKAFFEIKCIQFGSGQEPMPGNLFELMSMFAQEERDDMREMATEAYKKEGKRDENPSKEQRLLAEERALACYRCADEVKAIK